MQEEGSGQIWLYLIIRDQTINIAKKNSGRQKTHDSAFMVVIFYAFFSKLNLIFFTLNNIIQRI